MKLICLVLVLLSHSSMAQQDTIFKYLNARQTDEGVLISFTIKGGITCSGVSVQRSDTTSGFNTLYEFSGVCGSPTSDESYTYLDKYPASNHINRYRLELGSLGIFSPLVEVHFLDFSKNGYVTGPNPCRELCSIWFSNSSESEHEMKLFNSQGELTRLLKTSGNRFDLDALNLGPGVYVFTIQRDKETKNTGRLLIL